MLLHQLGIKIFLILTADVYVSLLPAAVLMVEIIS
jgi:hypothetical protein